MSVLFRQHSTSQQGVYSLSSPWGRAHIASEMRDAIANLQSLYQRHGRVFSDGPSKTSDVSCRTGGRNLQHQSSAENEAPAVVRQRIAAPANKLIRSLPLHVTVVQDTLHVKALTTVQIHQCLWLGGISTPNPLELQAGIGRL